MNNPIQKLSTMNTPEELLDVAEMLSNTLFSYKHPGKNSNAINEINNAVMQLRSIDPHAAAYGHRILELASTYYSIQADQTSPETVRKTHAKMVYLISGIRTQARVLRTDQASRPM